MKNTGAASACAGRTSMQAPRNAPASAADLAVTGPESPKAKSAAPMRRVAASGSEKSHAEYANSGVPSASASVTAIAVRGGIPRLISRVRKSAAARADHSRRADHDGAGEHQIAVALGDARRSDDEPAEEIVRGKHNGVQRPVRRPEPTFEVALSVEREAHGGDRNGE